MNCKNCGTPVVPGKDRCPTCNILYTESDALKIPEISTDSFYDGLLIDDNPKENEILKTLPTEAPPVSAKELIEHPKEITITKEVDLNEIIPIKPPEVDTQIIATPVEPIKEIITEETKEKPLSHFNNILPDRKDRGSNKIFVVMGILLILLGVGFFVYVSFINPKFIDEIVLKFNPKVEPPTIEYIKYDNIKKYIKEKNTKKEVLELLNNNKQYLKHIQFNEESVKATFIKTSSPIMENSEVKIKEIEENFLLNGTYTISMKENESVIEVLISKNLETLTDAE
ncbi:MAG: hypothetical protein RSD09_04800 [Bacilli bacterium]